jgi:hypothetical protein
MKVSAEYAVEHFEDIASAVDNGEEVEIARPHKPALQLVRSDMSVRMGKRVLGAGTALTALPSEEELERIDREWKREIDDKAIGVVAE